MTTSQIESSPPNSLYRRNLHIVACVTACFIFPLVIVGAGVTSKDAGMAYPDWPTSSGHLVNPPSWWQNEATRWEHGHRLIGWTVGMLAILLVVFSWSSGGTVRNLGLATLIAIIVQGVMGGLRVTQISTTLAMMHGIWGQLCFCLACVTALRVSRSWQTTTTRISVIAANVLQRLCLCTTLAILIQLILGSALRHFHGDTALILHLIWSVVVSLLVGWVVLWSIGIHRSREIIRLFGWMMGILMVIQLTLGGAALVITVMGGTSSAMMAWAVPSAHVAVGSLLLVSSLLLTLIAYHRLMTVNPQSSDTAASPVAIL